MKRAADTEAGGPEKKSAVSVSADARAVGVYFVHDNGGRPFKVDVQWPGDKAEVKVFKHTDEDDDDDDDEDAPGDGTSVRVVMPADLSKMLGEDSDEDDEDEEKGGGDETNDQGDGEGGQGGQGGQGSEKGKPVLVQMEDPDEASGEGEEEEGNYEEAPCNCFAAERVFVGQCPKHGSRMDGNSVLLKLEGLKYVFVGEEVFSFTAKSPITKYISLVGNNDVPYPWAVDEQGWRYLMTSSVVLSSKMFESADADPYELYFDKALITADIGLEPPQQPAIQFQGITEFWIGEDQYTMRYEPNPEEDFDRLAAMGELAVVKGGAKTKLSKADYVKLMQDFADEMGFQPLPTETLLERQI